MMLRREWALFARALALLTIAVSVLQPFPPSKIRMAKGQANSGLEVMAEKYRDYLKKYGVDVELVASSGGIDNMNLVSKGEADVGLSQSGLPAANNIIYLGSVAYQPVWLLYRGPPPTSDNIGLFLLGKRLSINVEGSGTRAMADLFLGWTRPEFRTRTRLLSLNNTQTVEGLKDGAIDAAFLLASYQSKNIQELLQDPTIGIYSFPATRGFAHQVNFTEAITLPAGAINYFPLKPASDVNLVATTMTLIARDTLHPATQSLLLAASKAIAERSEDPFARAKGFPAFVDRNVPRSAAVERFFDVGPPALTGRVPYWLASLVDAAWVSLVALIAIAYPLLRIMPSYRRLTFDALISRRYRMLRDLIAQSNEARTMPELAACRVAAEQLAASAQNLWVPSGCSSTHGGLLVAITQFADAISLRIRTFDAQAH